jgi:ribosome-associated protein
MIHITPTLAISEHELVESFIRSSGPGGQNVNKLSTAVELRFDAARSPALDAETFSRLKRLAGRRMTADGLIIIKAQTFRTQDKNRAAALARLIDLLRRAAEPVPLRKSTRPTFVSKQRRRRLKARRSEVKKLRSAVAEE